MQSLFATAMLAPSESSGSVRDTMRLMPSLLLGVLAFILATSGPVRAGGQLSRVVVIPVKGEISDAQFYIIRHGLKQAIEAKADTVVLDIKTPGGSLESTFEIMEALEKFPGHTLAYVDNEAMSAGAFISAVTQEIWFAPDGIIGAAAPVQSGGQDVDATMKQKLVSYLKARMRAVSEGKGRRGEVISAMIDSDEELRVGDALIKPKGELLSLTAKEAMKGYGVPQAPLIGSGIAGSIDELLTQRLGAGRYQIEVVEISWSENLAVMLNRLSPILIGIGMFALFLELKTPGFGLFGITGVALLAVVFLSGYVAGLSGHEPMILFALGIVLVFLELLFFHTAGFLGVAGVLAVIASLIWGTADLWPGESFSTAWQADAFARPLANLGLGAAIAVALGLALAKFIPKGWFWQHFVLASSGQSTAQAAGGAPAEAGQLSGLIGREAIVATDLRPTGQILIDGHRLEARILVGDAVAGQRVRVTGTSDFALVVERASQ